MVDILEELPLTRDLSPAHLRAVAGCSKVRTFGKGEYVWRQGEQSSQLYLIQSGQVGLEISVPGQGPFRIEIVGEGDFLGCSSLLTSVRCQFDACALTPVSCLAIQAERLHRLMGRDQELGYVLLKRMAGMMAQKLESARLRLFEMNALERPRTRQTSH
jgi:CRP/FNR family cyclic AMP-dependent transcriptional regulator